MRETILSIALTAIAAGIFKLLMPDSSFKKQIAFLTACFFVISCINLISGGFDLSELEAFTHDEGAYVDFSVEAYRLTQTEIANELARDLKEKLREKQISVDEIYVIIDISSSYSISIKQVRLAFSSDNASYSAAAEELVKKEVGDDIEIITEIKGR